MKRLIAIVLSLVLAIGLVTPTFAAEKKLPFEPGTKGTFWAPVFGGPYDGYDSITSVRYTLNSDKLEDEGPKAVAKEAAAALGSMPEGRKVIQLHAHLTAKYLSDSLCGGFVVNPASVEGLRGQIDSFFAALKEEGAQVDVVYDDMESWPSVYGPENRAIAHFRSGGDDVVTSYQKNGHLYEEWIKDKLIQEVQETPEYKNEIRPALEAAGYPFSPNYDLEYINIHPGAIAPRNARFEEELAKYKDEIPNMERSVQIFSSVISHLAQRDGYVKAVMEPIQKYYPDALLSNWRNHGSTGQLDVYDFNGNLNNAVGDAPTEHLVGPQANWVFYGCYKGWAGWLETRPPRNWRYDTFELFKNGFNQLKVDYIEYADAAISNNMSTSLWISNLQYSYAGTPYYAEAMFHGGLMNPTPFIFWPGGSTDMGGDLHHLQDIFEQLDELVGWEDRKPLVDDVKYVTQWDDRYILTGMYAGGKNVWRITPDLYTAGVTMENFLVDEKKPAFRIGNQNVEFPDGSYIYKPENDISEYGYWVISPEGSGHPREWRDNKHPMPGPQVPGGADGSPLGYTQKAYTEMPDELDLSRSREYKAPVTTTPEQGEDEPGTDVPPVTDVVVQTLNLNPMRGDGAETPLFLGKLPSDSQNHWSRHTLAHMLALGIMTGSDIGLEPDKYITRAEFLTMLERILGAETIEFTGEITDVKAEDWHAAVMQTAVTGGWIDLDVVTGKANPDANITRAEMCSVMVKALSLTENGYAEFADSSSMLGKVKADVAKIADAGLILGYQDGTFRPNGVLTRAETACLFERLIKQIPKLFPEE